MQIPVAGQRRVQWVTFCIWISEMNGWILMSEDWRPRTITHLTHSLSFCYNKRESYLSRHVLSRSHCLEKSLASLHLFHSIVSLKKITEKIKTEGEIVQKKHLR